MPRPPIGAAARADLVREPVEEDAIAVHTRQAGEFAASYEALERDPFTSCFTYSRMRLQLALDEALPPAASGARAIDVGCGTGHHLSDLAARGFEVAGIDGSPAMLGEARRAVPGADLRQAEVDALPFAEKAFDLALCIEVLRYLADPEPCLAEMARVLAPGAVCLTTAAPRWSVNGYALVNRVAVSAPVGRLVRLRQYFTTPAELEAQFARAGFSPVRVRAVYAGPINWVEHLAPRRLPDFLRRWEPIDQRLSESRALRGLSNMLLVEAVRAT